MECKRCGKCCENNGLIPPLLAEYGDADAAAPEWLKVLVRALRLNFGHCSEEYVCVFLTEDRRCAIHDVKPTVCRDFSCDDH